LNFALAQQFGLDIPQVEQLSPVMCKRKTVCAQLLNRFCLCGTKIFLSQTWVIMASDASEFIQNRGRAFTSPRAKSGYAFGRVRNTGILQSPGRCCGVAMSILDRTNSGVNSDRNALQSHHDCHAIRNWAERLCDSCNRSRSHPRRGQTSGVSDVGWHIVSCVCTIYAPQARCHEMWH